MYSTASPSLNLKRRPSSPLSHTQNKRIAQTKYRGRQKDSGCPMTSSREGEWSAYPTDGGSLSARPFSRDKHSAQSHSPYGDRRESSSSGHGRRRNRSGFPQSFAEDKHSACSSFYDPPSYSSEVYHLPFSRERQRSVSPPYFSCNKRPASPSRIQIQIENDLYSTIHEDLSVLSKSYILSQPIDSIKRIQSAVDHIMKNGGPDNILYLPPLPEPDIGHDLTNELMMNLQGKESQGTNGNDGEGDINLEGFDLPDWYVEFASRYKDTKPGDEQFETNFVLQYIIKYILENGGPERIETMAVPVDTLGSKYVCNLRGILFQARNSGIFLDRDTLPSWYVYFLEKYGFPIPSRKDSPAYQNLVKHILKHGPSNIETMSGYKKGPLKRLQRSIKKQMARFGKVTYLPCWYRHFIHDYQLPIKYDVDPELFKPENLNKTSQDILESEGIVITPKARTVQSAIDYILGNGGPEKIETMPEMPAEAPGSRLFSKLKHLKVMIAQKTSRARYPQWYLQFLEEYGFPLPTNGILRQQQRSESDGQHRYSEIWEYIADNGGHCNIETMRIDHSVRDWDQLARLQISLFKNKSKGLLLNYPQWYQKYLLTYEPDVKLPDKKERQKFNKKSGPVKNCLAVPIDMKPLMEYIFRNGGHANIETMPFDQSVDGWDLLAMWQIQLKCVRHYIPDWYLKYLSEYEPNASTIQEQLQCRLLPN